MFGRKKSYLIELRAENGDVEIFHHVLCTVTGKPKITETIKSLDPEYNWVVLSISEIDNEDAIELQKYLESRE